MANAYRVQLVHQISTITKTIGTDLLGSKVQIFHVFRYFLGSDRDGMVSVQRTQRGRLIVTSCSNGIFTEHRIHTMRTRDLRRLRDALMREYGMWSYRNDEVARHRTDRFCETA